MTQVGLDVFDNRRTYDEEFLQAKRAQQVVLTEETERGLKSSKIAWANFEKLAPSYRKNYVGWVQGARKPETRKRRLKELIRVLEENKKPGMK